MHIVCPHCGGSAFRVPRTVEGTMDIRCIGCGKVTSIDVTNPAPVNVVKLIIPHRPGVHGR